MIILTVQQMVYVQMCPKRVSSEANQILDCPGHPLLTEFGLLASGRPFSHLVANFSNV